MEETRSAALRRMAIRILQNFGPYGQPYLDELSTLCNLVIINVRKFSSLAILGVHGYKAPRNELTEVGRAFVREMNKTCF